MYLLLANVEMFSLAMVSDNNIGCHYVLRYNVTQLLLGPLACDIH